MERQSGVTVDCLITGRYPGSGKPGPLAFPDPSEASQEIDKIRVLTLPQLIQFKLAARRYYDFGDGPAPESIQDESGEHRQAVAYLASHPDLAGKYVAARKEGDQFLEKYVTDLEHLGLLLGHRPSTELQLENS